MTNMKTKNWFLFLIATLIWGSTWFTIKFQLGNVNPILSVAYRSMLAGIILIIIAWISKFRLRFSAKDHFFLFLQGILMYGINYWMVYLAEQSLKSGLVAVIFSLMIFFIILFNRLLLKSPFKMSVLMGAILGVAGTALLFADELSHIGLQGELYTALSFSIVSMILAALGNVVSAYNLRSNIPVLQINAFGMLYGAVVLFIVALFRGIQFTFDFKYEYIFSLIYLAVFGSVIAFTAYTKLLHNIGPDRSGYVILITPVIAMLMSTIFENYIWQKSAFAGILLLIAGNFVVMKKKMVITVKGKKISF